MFGSDGYDKNRLGAMKRGVFSGFLTLWCTGKKNFSVHSLQILTCVQGNS